MQPNNQDPKSWIDTTFRRIMFGFTFKDPKQVELVTGNPVSAEELESMLNDVERNLDAEIYVQALKRMGIQVMYHHAKNHGGVSCYDTKVGHRFSLMGDRDFFGELVEACRREGIIPGAMYQVGYSELQAKQHPEWQQEDVNGKSDWHRLCSNNPEWRAIVMAQTEEIAQYDIGAFMYDELSFGWFNLDNACYCPHCRALFRKEIGGDIPEDEDWSNPRWRQFIEWRYDKIIDFLQEGDSILKRVNPSIAHTSIYYGDPVKNWHRGWDADRTAPIFDYLLTDFAGVHDISLMARFFRSLHHRRPEIATHPPLMLGSSDNYGYTDDSRPKPLDMFTAEVMTGLSNGVTPAFESAGWYNRRFWDKSKGTMASPSYDKLYLEVSKRIAQCEPWLTDTKRICHTALLHSRHTRDYRYHENNSAAYIECLLGWHTGLIHGQILYDMITQDKLSPEGLAPYSVLVLPNTACLSDKQVEVIREYVRTGGGLVATFSTSLFNEYGEQRSDFALSDVLGVSYIEGADSDYVVRENNPSKRDKQFIITIEEAHPFFEDVMAVGENMACWAPMVGVMTVGEAKGIGSFTIYVQEEDTGRAIASIGHGRRIEMQYPVMVTHMFGKGRTVYIPAKFASSYEVHGHYLLHRLMMQAVRWVGGTLPVVVDGPSSLEVNAFRQERENRLVVHLVNYATIPDRRQRRNHVIEDIPPVHDFAILAELPQDHKVKKVYLAPNKIPLDWTRKDGSYLRVTVPKLHIHGMVVIEYD